MRVVAVPLVEHFALGLDAPICLTWELTYSCNLACVHCLSSSVVSVAVGPVMVGTGRSVMRAD